jgi:ABC-type glycerol-3-phosphate transport system permease component
MIALMVPGTTGLLPLFRITKFMGLIDHTAALIGPYTAGISIFCLTILKNYYDTIPNQLLESAHIDGCTRLRAFISIIIPLSYPAVIVVIVWTFLRSWNELLLAMIFINDVSKATITIIPIKLAYEFNNAQSLGKMFAALTVTILPVVVLYAFLQKYFVYGLTGGAIKG